MYPYIGTFIVLIHPCRAIPLTAYGLNYFNHVGQFLIAYLSVIWEYVK